MTKTQLVNTLTTIHMMDRKQERGILMPSQLQDIQTDRRRPVKVKEDIQSWNKTTNTFRFSSKENITTI